MAEEEVDIVEEGSETPEAEPSPEPEPQPQPDQFTREQVMQMIQERDRQWEARTSAEAAKYAHQPAPAPANDFESEIASLYADNEDGKRTRETIEKHLKLQLRAMGVDPSQALTREEVERIAAEQSGRVREQIRSGLTITQEVQDLVHRSIIGDEDAALVQRAYSETISNPSMKSAAENPVNAPWILKGVVYDLIKSGKLKPGIKPRNTNPLTPGGPAPPPKPEPVDPKTSPFPSVRKMDKATLERARATSEANWRTANG